MKKKWNAIIHMKEKVNTWNMVIKFFFCLCLFSPVLPVNAYAQQESGVTIQQKKISVKQILHEIEKQTKIAFVYSPRDVDSLATLDANFTNAKVEEVLDFCLKDTELTWNRHSNTVVIKRKSTIAKGISKFIISGIVEDEQGNPLPGVTILIKGTARGVSSDRNGAFKLVVPDTTKVRLLFSFIGMKTKEVVYERSKEKKPLVVIMEENVNAMDEVVVTGYQTIDKNLSAASTYSVKMEDINVPGSTSLTDMLQGEIPGLMLQFDSSSPSSLPKIRMRGTATLSGDAAPLWVIDGIIKESPVDIPNEDVENAFTDDNYYVFGGAISGLNPADIESVTFLKDAAATAMYGTRAANGVIVITTKKGNPKKLSVNYSGNLKFQERPSYKKSADVMNSKQRMAITRELFDDFLLFQTLPTGGYEKKMIEYLKGNVSYDEVLEEYRKREIQNTDWFDLLFRNSISDNHTVSISGGSQQITYYMSLGLANDRGTQKGDDAKRYTLSMRLNAELTKWLNADIKINYADRKAWSYFSEDPMAYALQTSRTIDPDEHYVRKVVKNMASINGNSVSYENELSFNMLEELKNTSNTGRTKDFSGSINLNVKLLKGLTSELIFAYQDGRSLGIKYATEKSYYMAEKRGYDYGSQTLGSEQVKISRYPYGGYYSRREEESNRWEFRGTLKYNHIWNETHALNVMGGTQITSNKRNGFSTSEYGYFPDRGQTIFYEYNPTEAGYIGDDYWASTTKHNVTLTDRITNSVKILASLVYSFKSRYVLNAGFSVDGTNRFGENKRFRFSPIWSVSGRWNINEEDWMKEITWVNAFSVKASYGYQGNVVNSISPSLKAKYYSGINAAVEEFRLVLKSLPNNNLDWEKTQTINFGVDIALFKNRLAFSAEYYHKAGNKILYQRELPTEYGFDKTYLNDSKLRNYGYEFTLRGTIIKTQQFSWSLSANWAYNHNRLTRKVLRDSYSYYLNGTAAYPGKSVGSFWSWNFKGLNSEDGLPVFDYAEDKGYTLDEMQADPTKYLVYSGCKNPDITGGFRTNISYHNFSLSAAFAYALGAKKRLRYVYRVASSATYPTKVPTFDTNLTTEYLEHWRKAGDENFTDKPGFLRPDRDAGINSYYKHPGGSDGVYKMWDESNHRVVSADFMRCKSVTLSYRVPSKVLTKIKLSSMMFGLTGSNLFVVKNKKLHNQDPEASSSKVPLLPSYTFSINVGF